MSIHEAHPGRARGCSVNYPLACLLAYLLTYLHTHPFETPGLCSAAKARSRSAARSIATSTAGASARQRLDSSIANDAVSCVILHYMNAWLLYDCAASDKLLFMSCSSRSTACAKVRQRRVSRVSLLRDSKQLGSLRAWSCRAGNSIAAKQTHLSMVRSLVKVTNDV